MTDVLSVGNTSSPSSDSISSGQNEYTLIDFALYFWEKIEPILERIWPYLEKIHEFWTTPHVSSISYIQINKEIDAQVGLLKDSSTVPFVKEVEYASYTEMHTQQSHHYSAKVGELLEVLKKMSFKNLLASRTRANQLRKSLEPLDHLVFLHLVFEEHKTNYVALSDSTRKTFNATTISQITKKLPGTNANFISQFLTSLGITKDSESYLESARKGKGKEFLSRLLNDLGINAKSKKSKNNVN